MVGCTNHAISFYYVYCQIINEHYLMFQWTQNKFRSLSTSCILVGSLEMFIVASSAYYMDLMFTCLGDRSHMY